MAKHTPGPWHVWTDKALDDTPYIKVYQRTPDDEHITVCTMGVSDGEVWGGYAGEEEDALLIAAAPDLLKACEALIEAQRRASAGETGGFGLYHDAVELARAVVEKLKGDNR